MSSCRLEGMGTKAFAMACHNASFKFPQAKVTGMMRNTHCGRTMLVCAAKERARSERERLWKQAFANRKPPFSGMGAGGNSSRSFARYSSSVSTHKMYSIIPVNIS
jgi:hypothetical protein